MASSSVRIISEPAAPDWDAVELSRTLGDRITVTNGPGREREFTDAILRQLRDDKLIAVVVPASHGGPGLGTADIARITYNISRLSGCAGLIYAMHMSQAFSVIRHAPATPFFDGFIRRMLSDQMLIGSGTSEVGVGGDIFGSICAVEDLGEGALRIVKETPIISYFHHAGAVLITAMREVDGRKKQVLVTGEKPDMDWVDGKEMQLMGMRGIVNQGFTLTTRFSEEAIFPEDFPAIQRVTMTPVINIMWAAVWSGIAWQAIDRAKAFLAKSDPKDTEVGPVMRRELSQLVNKHYTMNAIIRDAIAEDEANQIAPDMTRRMGQTARNARMKIICSELLQEICQGAMGLIGMASYSVSGPFSIAELLSDALSAKLMVSNYRLSARNAKVERFLEENI